MITFSLDDRPVKAADHPPVSMLPIQLRQLVIMINGQRSVRELLSLGLHGVELMSFDLLSELGFIHSPGARGGPPASARGVDNDDHLAPAPRQPRAKGLSEARFAVVDLLLDVSMRDLSAQVWVDRMESARTIELLRAEVEELCRSKLAAKYPNLAAAVRQAMR